ncbi:MAG: hypothetical protein K9H84_02465 [Bacteroidales bacterium]|nr:hypothetical protein [Bacteroidales bacterium]
MPAGIYLIRLQTSHKSPVIKVIKQ